MKRINGKLLIIMLIIVAAVFSLTACNTGSGNGNGNELKFDAVYAMAVEAGYTGTLDELSPLLRAIARIKSPYQKVIRERKPNGLCRSSAQRAQNGVTA